MFVVYCLLDEEEKEKERSEESKDVVDSHNSLNLLYNLDLPNLVIKVSKKNKKHMMFLRDIIAKLDKRAPTSLNIALPQIFTIDVAEENEEVILEKLMNFEDPEINTEGYGDCIFYIGSFLEFRELINNLFHLSPEAMDIEDAEINQS